MDRIKVINSWAVSILRYGAGVLEWRVDELKGLDRKSPKLLIMHKGSTQNILQTDFTLVKKREEKD